MDFLKVPKYNGTIKELGPTMYRLNLSWELAFPVSSLRLAGIAQIPNWSELTHSPIDTKTESLKGNLYELQIWFYYNVPQNFAEFKLFLGFVATPVADLKSDLKEPLFQKVEANFLVHKD